MSRGARWLLLLVVGWTVSSAAAFAVGWKQPEEYNVSVEAELHAKAETVWASLTDFASWPEWSSAIHGMERLPDVDGQPAWVATTAWGSIPIAVDRVDSKRRRLWVHAGDPSDRWSEGWSFAVDDEQDWTSIRVFESGGVEGALVRFFDIFRERTEPEARAERHLQFLRDLGHHLGETVEPRIRKVEYPRFFTAATEVPAAGSRACRAARSLASARSPGTSSRAAS